MKMAVAPFESEDQRTATLLLVGLAGMHPAEYHTIQSASDTLNLGLSGSGVEVSASTVTAPGDVASDLLVSYKVGDHVEWNRKGWWHPAIVASVYPLQVTTIGQDSPFPVRPSDLRPMN